MYLDYYSSMWDTLCVIDPDTHVSLAYNNSCLVKAFPKYEDRDNFLKNALAKEIEKKNLTK